VIGVKILNRELFRAVKARCDKMVENRGDDYDEKAVLPADAHGQEIEESTVETVEPAANHTPPPVITKKRPKRTPKTRIEVQI